MRLVDCYRKGMIFDIGVENSDGKVGVLLPRITDWISEKLQLLYFFQVINQLYKNANANESDK